MFPLLWFLDTDVFSNLTGHEGLSVHFHHYFNDHNHDELTLSFPCKWFSFLPPPCCNPDVLPLAVAPSALIENVQSREVGRANELSTWRPHLNTITVSKKRNWLQQSSLGRNHCSKEEPQGMLGAEEEGCQYLHQLPPPPSPSPEHLRPSGGAPSRPARLHLPQVSLKVCKFGIFGNVLICFPTEKLHITGSHGSLA